MSTNNSAGNRDMHRAADNAKKDWKKAEAESEHLWEVAKERILQPHVAGGLMGVVNVGLISWASYQLYTDPFLRRDTSFLTTAGISALVLFGVEGYAVDKYAQTPGGRENRRRAKEEGSEIYRHTREIVLRPGVMGGLIGLFNVGILGTVGYYAYSNWDRPTWDRGTVAAVSAGLVVLAGGEGLLAGNSTQRR